MRSDADEVWWLYGPPCVGKSTTAWELYDHLMRGKPRAYFDVDQVGMCYPEPTGDPGRFALKTRAAGALVRRLADAGAHTVVVSGVLDKGSLQEVAEEIHGASVTFCRLRVEPEELRRRVEARYGPEDVARALAEAQQWDQDGSGHPVVDVGECSPRDAARSVMEAINAGTPAQAVPASGSCAPSPPENPGRAVLICGPTAVGKSTVGFGLFMHLLETGRASAYLDLQQLRFLADVPLQGTGGEGGGHGVSAACVAGLWVQYRAVGTQDLVVTGSVEQPEDIEHYREALGETPLVVCRLRVAREQLRERILARTRGDGPLLAGDALIGLSAADVERVLQRSWAEQDRLDRMNGVDLVLDSDGLDPEVAAQRLAGMLDRRGQNTPAAK